MFSMAFKTYTASLSLSYLFFPFSAPLPLNCSAAVKENAVCPCAPSILSLPCGHPHNSFVKSTVLSSCLQRICLLPKVNRLSVQGFRGLPANCQLVNLIGLSPWALFLNQLGNELAVTSFPRRSLGIELSNRSQAFRQKGDNFCN